MEKEGDCSTQEIKREYNRSECKRLVLGDGQSGNGDEVGAKAPLVWEQRGISSSRVGRSGKKT